MEGLGECLAFTLATNANRTQHLPWPAIRYHRSLVRVCTTVTALRRSDACAWYRDGEWTKVDEGSESYDVPWKGCQGSATQSIDQRPGKGNSGHGITGDV